MPCDSIAYDTHDIDDALGLGLITLDDLDERRVLAASRRAGPRAAPGLSAATRSATAVVRELLAWQVTDLLEETARRLAADRHPRRSADVRARDDAAGRASGRSWSAAEGGPGAVPARARLPAPPRAADDGQAASASCSACSRSTSRRRSCCRSGTCAGGPGAGRTASRRARTTVVAVAGAVAGAGRRRLPGRHDRPVRPAGVPAAVPPGRRPVRYDDHPAAVVPRPLHPSRTGGPHMLLWLLRGLLRRHCPRDGRRRVQHVLRRRGQRIWAGRRGAPSIILAVGGLVLFTDVCERNKQITTISAVYFGLLLGLLLGWLFSLAVEPIHRVTLAARSRRPSRCILVTPGLRHRGLLLRNDFNASADQGRVSLHYPLCRIFQAGEGRPAAGARHQRDHRRPDRRYVRYSDYRHAS